ncbi:MAG: recombinase family protein [Candidatus Obscuribacterales bacterium]|nr:recombinase family protein [Candidatus Obscuribacterales bacterium]
MLIGYARVSTVDQDLSLQLDALKSTGCDRVFEDVKSGAREKNEGLEAAINFARPGDTLVVWRLDRLARSLRNLIDLVERLDKQQIGLKSLQESIDTTTSGGKLVFHIFGALAEFERAVIRDRTNAGLQAARARGRKGGRPVAMDAKKLAMAKNLALNPQIPVEEICNTLGVSKSTFYKYTSGSTRNEKVL